MSEYFTLNSLLAYPTAIIAVTVLTSTISAVAGEVVRPWLKAIALITSMFLAFLGAYVTGGDGTRWIVAFFNGCVLLLGASGANAGLAYVAERKRPQYASVDPESFGVVPAPKPSAALARWL